MALPCEWGDLVRFARDVIAKIAKPGFEAARSNRNTRLTGFYVALFSFHEDLRSIDNLRAEQIRNILEELERVCRWPNQTQPGKLVTLTNVNTTQDGWKTALNGIHAYSSASDDKLDELTLLILPPKLRFDADIEVSDISADMIEYPKHVNELLGKALHRHLACNCTESETKQHSFLTELYLTPTSRLQPDGDVHFELLLSTLQASHATDTYWQDFLLLVHSKSTSDGHSTATSQFSSKHGEFCALMNRKMGARLPCRVLKEEVRKMKPTRPVRKIADAPAVSLASVLACLTVEIKLGLSYILARSLWEFYASDVIQTELSTQTVHFMRARSDQEPSLYVQRPCLFLQAASPDSAFVEYNDDGVSLHHHPKVLALGVMMVEIGMGSLIQSAGENINSTYLSALEATQTQLNSSLTTKRERLEREKPMPAYWKIVEDCLDTELFENDDSEFDPRDSIRLEKRQRILYDRVVLPLEKLLRGTAYFDRLEKLESLPYHDFSERIPNHARKRKYDAAGLRTHLDQEPFMGANGTPLLHHATPLLHHATSISGRISKKHKSGAHFYDDCIPGNLSDDQKSEAWISKLRSTYESLRCNVAIEKRVRVAVLDSGIDLQNVRFDELRIKDVREDARDDGDVLGHGTHVADVLHQVAPDADIFIVRITTNDENVASPAQIAKAIEYAIEHWKVDVITMSFGFPANESEGHHELHQVIKSAHAKRITLLAAASNNGGNSSRAYPAQYDEFICIHSTDSFGNPSKFNPTQWENRDNFSTLGERVEAAWPLGVDENPAPTKLKTGTSFATPIAAGIVAILIQYARIHSGELMARKGSDGVKAMLRKIAEKRDGYQYLVVDCNEPSNFFSNIRGDGVKSDLHWALKRA